MNYTTEELNFIRKNFNLTEGSEQLKAIDRRIRELKKQYHPDNRNDKDDTVFKFINNLNPHTIVSFLHAYQTNTDTFMYLDNNPTVLYGFHSEYSFTQNLNPLIIPSKIVDIAMNAFYAYYPHLTLLQHSCISHIKTIIFPENLKILGPNCFRGFNDLTHLDLSNIHTTEQEPLQLHFGAFSGNNPSTGLSSLKEVKLPKHTKFCFSPRYYRSFKDSDVRSPFERTDYLRKTTEIELTPNTFFFDFTDINMPDDCFNRRCSYVVPVSKFTCYKEFRIGQLSFVYSNLHIVHLNNYNILPDSYLLNCQTLEELTGTENLESIGSWSLCYCLNLRELKLSSKLKFIDEYAFHGINPNCKFICPQEVLDLFTVKHFGSEELMNSIISNCTITED